MMPNSEMIYIVEDDIVKEIDENLLGRELDPNRSRQYIDPGNFPYDIQRIYHGSDLHVVEQYIDTLDPTLANPLKFSIYRGYTSGEIAEKMGLGVDEIEERLRTAREIVATHFPQLKQHYTSKQVYSHMRMEQGEHDRPSEHHLSTQTQACVDETRFKTQILLYQKELYRYAYKLTRDHELAKDLVKNTFEKAIKFQEKHTGGNLEGWLKRIMYNNSIDEYRKNTVRATGSLDTTYNLSSKTELFDELHATLLLEQIKKFVSTFSTCLSSTRNLRYISGLEYEDIAKEQCIDISAVKSRLYQARQKILQQFPELIVKKVKK